MSYQALRRTISAVAVNFVFVWGVYFLLPTVNGYSLPTQKVAQDGDMALIPSGEFVRGSDDKDGRMGIDYGVDETPIGTVSVDAFFIDKYEVTNIAYKRYLEYLLSNRIRLPFYDDIGVPIPEEWRYRRGGDFLLYKEGRDNHPVSDVDWYMADGYCRWVNKRLPTEMEWEKAARGDDGRRYTWGNEENDGHANTRSTDVQPSGSHPGFPEKIGSFPKDISPYGVYDMGGNVAEWTSSRYLPYPGSVIADRPVFKEENYVVRGGSYLIYAKESARVASRYHLKPTRMARAADAWHGDGMLGFRCAK